MTFFERQICTGQLGQLVTIVIFIGLNFFIGLNSLKTSKHSLNCTCMRHDFIQAIAIGKAFINVMHPKEKKEGLGFHRGK